MCEQLTPSERSVKETLDECIQGGRVDIMDDMLNRVRHTFRLHRLYANTARYMRWREAVTNA